jgi:sugar lactone lactonase YvrE
MTVRNAALFLTGVLCVLATSAGNADVLPSNDSPIVSTLAGDRTDGVVDGPAASADFMQPAGVAIAPDGAVIVADAAAHNIRRVFDGTVTTIAGVAAPGRYSQYRTGAFHDGPALEAHFNRPVGVAVGKSGAIYIADANNFRIRKLFDGQVTTYAGSAVRGGADGPGATATFQNPNGIAVDDEENVYVADPGNGIRKITPAGNVTTLDLPEGNNAISIAAEGAGTNLVLAYSTKSSVHLVAGGTNLSFLATNDRFPPGFEGYTYGFAYGVAILNDHLLITSDIAGDAVRFVRFPHGSSTNFEVRSLAGGVRDAADPVGGFRDGAPEEALVRAPMGVAVTEDGSVVVADTGNRILRKIDHISRREIISNEDGVFSFPPSDYRIAFIGNSYVYCCSAFLWPESIPGTFETGLLRDQERIGLPGAPYVIAWRMDGASITAARSFISTYFADGQADLVVLALNAPFMENEFRERPALQVNDLWKKRIPAELVDLARTLQANHTTLMLVVMPEGEAVSPLERMSSMYPAASYDFSEKRQASETLENVLKGTGLPTVTLLDPLTQEAESSDRMPLYYNWDRHLSREGAHWVGGEILRQVERLHPWAPARKP